MPPHECSLVEVPCPLSCIVGPSPSRNPNPNPKSNNYNFLTLTLTPFGSGMDEFM